MSRKFYYPTSPYRENGATQDLFPSSHSLPSSSKTPQQAKKVVRTIPIEYLKEGDLNYNKGWNDVYSKVLENRESTSPFELKKILLDVSIDLKASEASPRPKSASATPQKAALPSTSNRSLLSINFTNQEIEALTPITQTASQKGVTLAVQAAEMYNLTRIAQLGKDYHCKTIDDVTKLFDAEDSKTLFSASTGRYSSDLLKNLLHNKLLAIWNSIKSSQEYNDAFKLFILNNAKNFIVQAFNSISIKLAPANKSVNKDIVATSYQDIVKSAISDNQSHYNIALSEYIKYLNLVWTKQKQELSNSQTMAFALTQPSAKPFVSRVLKGQEKISIENEVFAQWQVVALEDLEDKIIKGQENFASIVFNAPTGWGKTWIIGIIENLYREKINIVGKYDLNSSDAEIEQLQKLLTTTSEASSSSVKKLNRSRSPSPSDDRKKLIIFDEYFFQGQRFLELTGHGSVTDFNQLEELKERFKKTLIQNGYLVIDSCATETPEFLELKRKRGLSKAIKLYKDLIEIEYWIEGTNAIDSEKEEHRVANGYRKEDIDRLERKINLRAETIRTMKESRKKAFDTFEQAIYKDIRGTDLDNYRPILSGASNEKLLYIIPDKDVTQFSADDFKIICGNQAINALVITPFFDREQENPQLQYKIFYQNHSGKTIEIVTTNFDDERIPKDKSKTIAVFGNTNSVGGDYGPFSRDITGVHIQTRNANGKSEQGKSLSEYKASPDLVQWLGRARSRAKRFTTHLYSDKTKEDFLVAISANDNIQDNARLTGYKKVKSSKPGDETSIYARKEEEKLVKEFEYLKSQYNLGSEYRFYKKQKDDLEKQKQLELEKIERQQEIRRKELLKEQEIAVIEERLRQQSLKKEAEEKASALLNQEKEKHTHRIRELETKKENLQQKELSLNSNTQALEKQNASLKQKIQEIKNKIESQNTYYQQQIEDNEKRVAQKLMEEQERLNAKLKELKQAHDQSVKALSSNYIETEKKIEQHSQEAQKQLENEQEQLRQELELKRSEQEKALGEMQKQLQAEQERLWQEQEQARKGHEQALLELKQVKEGHEQALREIQQQLENEQEGLRRELEQKKAEEEQALRETQQQLENKKQQLLQQLEQTRETHKQALQETAQNKERESERLLSENKKAVESIKKQIEEAEQSFKDKIHKAKVQAFLNDALLKLEAILNQDNLGTLQQITNEFDHIAQEQDDQEAASSIGGEGNRNSLLSGIFAKITEAGQLHNELLQLKQQIDGGGGDRINYTDDRITETQQRVNYIYDSFLGQIDNLQAMVSNFSLQNIPLLTDHKARLSSITENLRANYEDMIARNRDLDSTISGLNQETQRMGLVLNTLQQDLADKTSEFQRLESFKQNLEQQQKQLRDRVLSEGRKIAELTTSFRNTLETELLSMPENAERSTTRHNLEQLSQENEELVNLQNIVLDLESRLANAQQEKQRLQNLADQQSRSGEDAQTAADREKSQAHIQSLSSQIADLQQQLNDAVQNLKDANTKHATNLQNIMQSHLGDGAALHGGGLPQNIEELAQRAIRQLQQQKPQSRDISIQTELDDDDTTSERSSDDESDNQERQPNTQQPQSFLSDNLQTIQPTQTSLEWSIILAANIQFAPSKKGETKIDREYLLPDPRTAAAQNPTFLQPDAQDAKTFLQFGKKNSTLKSFTTACSKIDLLDLQNFENEQDFTKKLYNDFSAAEISALIAVCKSIELLAKDFSSNHDSGGFKFNNEHLQSAASSYQELKDMNIAQAMQNYRNPDPNFAQTVLDAVSFIKQIDKNVLRDALQNSNQTMSQSRADMASQLQGILKPEWAERLQAPHQVGDAQATKEQS